MQSVANPFYKRTAKKANRTRNRNRNRTRNNNGNNNFDKYIIDNEDDLLDENAIQRKAKSSGNRVNAVRTVLRSLIYSHGLDDDIPNLLLEYIIKKNSGLTNDQKANFLLFKTSPENISKLVRNIRNRANRTRNNNTNDPNDH